MTVKRDKHQGIRITSVFQQELLLRHKELQSLLHPTVPGWNSIWLILD